MIDKSEVYKACLCSCSILTPEKLLRLKTYYLQTPDNSRVINVRPDTDNIRIGSMVIMHYISMNVNGT